MSIVAVSFYQHTVAAAGSKLETANIFDKPPQRQLVVT
jgi:hypothetical protein